MILMCTVGVGIYLPASRRSQVSSTVVFLKHTETRRLMSVTGSVQKFLILALEAHPNILECLPSLLLLVNKPRRSRTPPV